MHFTHAKRHIFIWRGPYDSSYKVSCLKLYQTVITLIVRTDSPKQTVGSRLDTAELDVGSEPALFATYPADLRPIRGVVKDEYLVIILGYFSYFSIKTYVVGIH